MATVVQLAVDIDPEQAIIEAWLRGKPARASSGTKAAQAEASGLDVGFRAGITTALSIMATARRLAAYREMFTPAGVDRKWVPAVESWDVEKFLKSARESFDDWDPDHRSESEFWEDVMNEFDNVVFNEDVKQIIEEERRKQVLENVREPLPEDEEWLLEHAESFRAVAQPYEAAIARLRKAKDE